ncbi:cell envelope integrity protein TolA [Alcanivorax sp. 1008]|uniref:cell envelope integrity protein TolA n=1 Tax=Alcanivorax sp. 1008 TaxID=2816853 RepID=UPI001E042DA0|nr:cell envelope integrity protein TolA [Alcanivorax sp. 1008]MCC1496445.1 cell envelope integrity protein TolA [Alcanivorax sp. 1008]
MDRDLGPALAIALTLHLLIVGAVTFTWSSEPTINRVRPVPPHVMAVVMEKPAAKPAPKPVAKPKPKPVAKPEPKPTPKPKPKPVAKPVPKPEPKPVAKPQPAPEPAIKPAPSFTAPKLDELLATEDREIDFAVAEQQAQAAREATETETYAAAIRSALSQRWIIPATAREKTSLSADIRIRLLPGGEVLDVNLIRSSGDRAFDDSAMSAVRSAGRLPVPSGELFNKNFRDITINFNPQMAGQ